jgi:hypothetical protein
MHVEENQGPVRTRSVSIRGGKHVDTTHSPLQAASLAISCLLLIHLMGVYQSIRPTYLLTVYTKLGVL